MKNFVEHGFAQLSPAEPLLQVAERGVLRL